MNDQLWKHEYNQKKWKITYESYCELTEDEKKDKVIADGCRATVKLSQIDSKIICVEFTR